MKYSVTWTCSKSGEHRSIFSDDYMACAIAYKALLELDDEGIINVNLHGPVEEAK